jgi:phosphoglycolate phosphatase-like HAD superfamily hydrolase
MITTLIIDLDDTLCLTEAACFELENSVLTEMGLIPMTRDIHIATWGRPLFEAIVDRSPGIDLPEFRRIYAVKIEEFTAAGNFDVIPEKNYRALDQLISKGIELFILTSREVGELKSFLSPDHLLSERLKGIYHKNNTRYHKPDKRVFDELLSDHNLQPEDCAYVGDSLTDAHATIDRGIAFIASLESGLRAREDFADLPVAAFINKFPDVVGTVKELND